jgi:hypothetical protein
MAEQPVLDVLGLERFAQQRIVAQVDHPDRQVVAGAPEGVGPAQFVGIQRRALDVARTVPKALRLSATAALSWFAVIALSFVRKLWRRGVSRFPPCRQAIRPAMPVSTRASVEGPPGTASLTLADGMGKMSEEARMLARLPILPPLGGECRQPGKQVRALRMQAADRYRVERVSLLAAAGARSCGRLRGCAMKRRSVTRAAFRRRGLRRDRDQPRRAAGDHRGARARRGWSRLPPPHRLAVPLRSLTDSAHPLARAMFPTADRATAGTRATR